MPFLRDAFHRHAAYYEVLLRQADKLFLQGGEGVARGLQLFDLEWINIQTGQTQAENLATVNENDNQLCCDYPDAGVHLLHLRRHPDERIRWLKSALTAASRLENSKYERIHLGSLGVAYSDLGEPRRALECYEQLLSIVKDEGDESGEAQALGNFGSAYFQLNDFHKAIDYYGLALAIFQKLGTDTVKARPCRVWV